MNRRSFAKLLIFGGGALPFAGLLAKLRGEALATTVPATGTGSVMVTGCGFEPRAVMIWPKGTEVDFVSFDADGFTLKHITAKGSIRRCDRPVSG